MCRSGAPHFSLALSGTADASPSAPSSSSVRWSYPRPLHLAQRLMRSDTATLWRQGRACAQAHQRRGAATRPPDAEVPRHLGELLRGVVGRDEPERARVAPRQHLAVAREEDAARAVHPLCDDVRRQRVPVL